MLKSIQIVQQIYLPQIELSGEYSDIERSALHTAIAQKPSRMAIQKIQSGFNYRVNSGRHFYVLSLATESKHTIAFDQ